MYDTALRIGAKLGVAPVRVYLHTGTREGAKRLGIETKGVSALWPSELPEALRELEPYEVEDVLCIYKDKFLADVLDLRDEPACLPERPEATPNAP